MENLVKGERKSSPMRGILLLNSKPPPRRKKKQRARRATKDLVQAKRFLKE